MIKTVCKIGYNFLASATGRGYRCKPLFPLYHVTPFCNLKCSYCTGFPEVGVSKDQARQMPCHDQDRYQLSTQRVKELVAILRKSFDFIFFTGGEPLVRPDIEEIIGYAASLNFTGISINTNSIMLPERESILNHISNLAISLDMLDEERYSKILGCSSKIIGNIIANVERYKRLESYFKYKLKIHCVIFPGRIDDSLDVLEFCMARDIAVCFSPLQSDYVAHKSLKNSSEYRTFIDHLILFKKRGKKISGTYGYYRNIRGFSEYSCSPLIIPRILPDGRILYPCRPKGTIGESILESGSFKRAMERSAARHEAETSCRRSCRIRCYIEPSIIMKRPLSIVREFV